MTTIDTSAITALLANPDLLARLTSSDKRDLLTMMTPMVKDTKGWPRAFVNRDTNRVYTPHSIEEHRFVYNDAPRRGLLRGGEGCLSATTRISGIPIPDWQPSPIHTVAGKSWSTGSYLKGQADLYRVQTSDHHEVEVTLDHRFLTPFGWRRLRDLSSGDLIAACDRQSDDSLMERSSYSWDRDSVDSHQYDELPTTVELIYQDKLRQLSLTGTCSPCNVCLDHPCKRYSSRHEEPTLPRFASLLRLLLDGGECALMECHNLQQFLRMFLLRDSASLSPPLGEHTWSSCCEERECQTSCGESEKHIHERCGASLLQQQCPDALPISQRRFDSFLTLTPSDYLLSDTGSPPHNNTYWTECQGVVFVRHGDYYDLSVPFWEHYEAHGLLHHNSGKSTAGIIKALNRVKRRMTGLMCSPNLPHFQRSLWKEFQRWCPWDCVLPAHRRMAELSWSPVRPFDIVFDNNTYIHMVGVKNAGSLEGPNLNWVHFDEARHYPDKSAITVLEGRIRIPGPKGEPPQMWYTTTPRMNWLFDFFGPVQCRCKTCSMEYKGEDGIEIQAGEPLKCTNCGSEDIEVQDDNYAFKKGSTVVRLSTKGNEPNLMKDFARVRGDPLTSAEKDVLLEGLWGQIEEGQPFLPSILWWDQCKEDIPVLDMREPVVISLDAATGSEYSMSDCFAIVGVTRHPDPLRAEDSVAVRFSHTWQARTGQKIDFRGTSENPGPERFLLRCCGYDLNDDGLIVPISSGYNVIRVVFDPKELHDMSQRLSRANVVSFREFGQTSQRYEADRQLLNLITHRRVVHDGNGELRMHMMNADRKLDPGGKRLRIAKRSKSMRIDLVVSLSMGAHEVLRLNL